MKKILLSFFIFSLLYSYENKFSYDINSSNTTINLKHIPEYTEVTGGYTRLSIMGEGHSTELGMPELPQFSTYFQLDPYKTYEFDFEVIDSYVVENIVIMPHQGMEKWEVEHVNILDEETYDSHAVYPGQNVVISDRIQGRGIEYVSIHVIPYKYYPKYQRLEVFEVWKFLVVNTKNTLLKRDTEDIEK